MSIVFYHTKRIEKAGKKSGPRRPTTPAYQRLSKLARAMGASMRMDLVTGITTFKDRIAPEELAAAWRSGNYDKLFSLIPWQELPGDLTKAAERVKRTVRQAGEIALEKMPPNANRSLRFDVENPRIRGYINARTGALIVGIQGDAQKVVQDTIARSFTSALTPDDVARQIRGSIGLLPRQERALANYRAGLEAENLDPDKINLFAASYEDRLLDYRASTIARTETRAAVNQGQLSVWQEGVNQGFLDKRTTKKEWFTDGDPCPVCDPMDGRRVGLEESFTVTYADGSTEEIDAPPVHPNCFCGVTLAFTDSTDEDGE